MKFVFLKNELEQIGPAPDFVEERLQLLPVMIIHHVFNIASLEQIVDFQRIQFVFELQIGDDMERMV